MKVAKVAAGLALGSFVVACASSSPTETGKALSPEMQKAIDSFVALQADPIVFPDGGVIFPDGATNFDPGSGTGNGSGTGQGSGSATSGGSKKGAGVGGIDPAEIGSALKSGATGIPSGGAASSGTGAGNGGSGTPSFGGGAAASGTGAGNGGVSTGSSASGGVASFAEAACYMIGNLCRYIARCASVGNVEGVCAIPSSCPSLVAEALSSKVVDIPPQATTIVRCFGDAIGSAACVSSKDLGEGLQSTFGRCGVDLKK
jgi:hypothetical protein